MRTIGSQKRQTLKEAKTVLIKMKGNLALTINADGIFETWAINDHFAGYVLEIDGVGYEFCGSVDDMKQVYSFLKDR